jgi:hypothetical protein
MSGVWAVSGQNDPVRSTTIPPIRMRKPVREQPHDAITGKKSSVFLIANAYLVNPKTNLG